MSICAQSFIKRKTVLLRRKRRASIVALRSFDSVLDSGSRKGLKVSCRLDRAKYATGRKLSSEEIKAINISLDDFHRE